MSSQAVVVVDFAVADPGSVSAAIASGHPIQRVQLLSPLCSSRRALRAAAYSCSRLRRGAVRQHSVARRERSSELGVPSSLSHVFGASPLNHFLGLGRTSKLARRSTFVMVEHRGLDASSPAANPPASARCRSPRHRRVSREASSLLGCPRRLKPATGSEATEHTPPFASPPGSLTVVVPSRVRLPLCSPRYRSWSTGDSNP